MTGKQTVLNVNHYAVVGKIRQHNTKILKNHWNPGKWVFIWEYSVRDFQWIPTWQGLDDLQKSFRSCDLDESSLSIGRDNFQDDDEEILAKTNNAKCYIQWNLYAFLIGRRLTGKENMHIFEITQWWKVGPKIIMQKCIYSGTCIPYIPLFIWQEMKIALCTQVLSASSNRFRLKFILPILRLFLSKAFLKTILTLSCWYSLDSSHWAL